MGVAVPAEEAAPAAAPGLEDVPDVIPDGVKPSGTRFDGAVVVGNLVGSTRYPVRRLPCE